MPVIDNSIAERRERERERWVQQYSCELRASAGEKEVMIETTRESKRVCCTRAYRSEHDVAWEYEKETGSGRLEGS